MALRRHDRTSRLLINCTLQTCHIRCAPLTHRPCGSDTGCIDTVLGLWVTIVRYRQVYLEVASLVQGLGGPEYGHFPFPEVVLDQLHPEALDGFLLQALVLVREGSVGARRQVLVASHQWRMCAAGNDVLQRCNRRRRLRPGNRVRADAVCWGSRAAAVTVTAMVVVVAETTTSTAFHVPIAKRLSENGHGGGGGGDKRRATNAWRADGGGDERTAHYWVRRNNRYGRRATRLVLRTDNAEWRGGPRISFVLFIRLVIFFVIPATRERVRRCLLRSGGGGARATRRTEKTNLPNNNNGACCESVTGERREEMNRATADRVSRGARTDW